MLFQLSSFGKDCVGHIPEIAITRPPTHGTVTLILSTYRVKLVMDRSVAHCIGQDVFGVTVMYTPMVWFRGTDSFALAAELSFGELEQEIERQAIILVR